MKVDKSELALFASEWIAQHGGIVSPSWDMGKLMGMLIETIGAASNAPIPDEMADAIIRAEEKRRMISPVHKTYQPGLDSGAPNLQKELERTLGDYNAQLDTLMCEIESGKKEIQSIEARISAAEVSGRRVSQQIERLEMVAKMLDPGCDWRKCAGEFSKAAPSLKD